MSEIQAVDYANANGILFTVTVGATDHKCVITHDALQSLCPAETDDALDKEIYWEFEDRIHWVARRMVNAGAQGQPLVLEPHCFS